ncbi:hypothetical protein FK531_04485 [Rhodococcus spelaei]|uniref:DUF8021 domain-containing protein n=1 Tax=Rhodococcus spelaei TaxID=2546320 RepID=A0A541BNW4_9NOCA|nr:hypothetical protein [Rhodococcus spelaei]TQF73938.1 hypothetical protein FK531_04485 [Rhodococcus spelaei]
MRTLRNLALSAAGVAVVLTTGSGIAAAAPNAADTPREAIARAYIDALVSHNAADVRFAPDATRVEAGLKTGFSGPQMTRDLEQGLQYRVIQGIRDLEMSEAGNTVSTTYLLDAGVAGTKLMTVEITETFDVPDGTIHAIVADIAPKSLS